MLVVLLGMLTSITLAKDIARTDYKITVPDSCTVDPEDSDIDLDHMTTINLPNDNTLIVSVVDDVSALDRAVAKMKAHYLGKMQKAQETPSALVVNRHGRGVTIRGIFNGGKFCFEVVSLSGKKKGFVVVSTYLASEEKEALPIVQHALDSFVIKE